MNAPKPGISRDKRIPDESLLRLEKQLKAGRKPSQQVLEQWVKKYGEPAQKIINTYHFKNNDKI